MSKARVCLSLRRSESDCGNLLNAFMSPLPRTSVVVLEDCKHGIISGNIAMRVNTAYARIKGRKTLRILMAGNELRNSNMLISVDDDVLTGEWKVTGNFENWQRSRLRLQPTIFCHSDTPASPKGMCE